MNPSNLQISEFADDYPIDVALLSGEIATHLNVIALPVQRNAAIATQLLDRARKSVLEHQQFVTVRREDMAFESIGPGVRFHVIRQDSAVRIGVLQLEANAQWVWPEGVLAQEILVLDGDLRDGSGTKSTQYDHCLLRPDRDLPQPGDAGARVYVRQLCAMEPLSAAELAWWSNPADDGEQGWLARSPGLEMKSLRCVGTVVSKLARLAPGGRLRDHGHDLDEDCMMLVGSLQMGDILLRDNDYQLAPAGANHVNASSDTGALFYIHGNLPKIQ